MINKEVINQTRDEILALLSDVDCKGMNAVIRYLNESDFFTVKCHSHHKFNGGLAIHSLGVYREIKKCGAPITERQARIVALLHDICKSHHPQYNHILPRRHGRRSVKLLEALGLAMTPEECQAIMRHMHPIDRIPSTQTYDSTNMLLHYISRCDHRDAATYPGNFESFTPDEDKNLRYQTDTLLYSTHRPGIEIVIDQLHRSRDMFYNAPASVHYHNNFRGGLARHSWEVYQEAKKMYDALVKSGRQPSFGMDSIILCSLLHDVCKMDEYEMKDGRPEHAKHYPRNNAHGIKSDRRLRRWHLDLTEEEHQAIIWHMGIHAKDAIDAYATTYDAVASSTPLVRLIHEADSRAAKKHLPSK